MIQHSALSKPNYRFGMNKMLYFLSHDKRLFSIHNSQQQQQQQQL